MKWLLRRILVYSLTTALVIMVFCMGCKARPAPPRPASPLPFPPRASPPRPAPRRPGRPLNSTAEVATHSRPAPVSRPVPQHPVGATRPRNQRARMAAGGRRRV
jgi:hypothetical protein